MNSPVRPPTRKEIDFYYKTHRSQFRAPERVHVRQIVKNVEDAANRDEAQRAIEAAQQALASGLDFAEAARRFSDCRENGGDLGWFARGFMVPEFEEVVFRLLPRQVTSIFETRFGFHIVQMLEKRIEGIRPLSEVREVIVDALYKQRFGKTSLP